MPRPARLVSFLFQTFLFATLLVPLHMACAQATRYRLIDLGTFGGPNSAETVEFPFVNNAGTVVGFADTANPDPFNPGVFIPHAFRWQRGALTDLGTLPGGHGAFAIWSNDRGQVVGLSDNGQVDPDLGVPEGIGVLWDSNNRITNLGTLGGTQSLAAIINARGQAIGVAANAIPDPLSLFGWATQTRAVLWTNGKIQDLGTLGGTDASASYINDNGQIAGNSYIDLLASCPFDFPVTTHPFLWESGKMTDLGTLGGNCAGTVKINNRGQIAGTSTMPGDFTDHPFLWQHGSMTDLGTLGGTFGIANSLNEGGDVVGVATTPDDEQAHAFFWRNGVMADLGSVGNDGCSIAHSVNERGQVVGTSLKCADFVELHGFLWQPGGTIIDLNSFVPPELNMQITDGETINDAGEIAGSGLLPDGSFHAILLVPCQDSHDPHCRAADGAAHLTATSTTNTAQNRRAIRNLFFTNARSCFFGRHLAFARSSAVVCDSNSR